MRNKLGDVTEFFATRRLVKVFVILVAFALPLLVIESPVASRVVAIACVCLFLWLLEIVPPFVPTLLLWILAPLLISTLDPRYAFTNTLKWAADPVLALFFGGFVLGVGATRQGLDRKLAGWVFGRGDRSTWMVLATAMGCTAFLSMWMSNIAAAALMFACIRPVLKTWPSDLPARRTLLVGVAFGANLGGIATPVGTGPNGIAIASISGSQQISFIEWMTFALPLTLAFLIVAYFLLMWRGSSELPDSSRMSLQAETETDGGGRSQGWYLAVLSITVLLWLTEPLHGISAPIVALGAAALLFLSGLLAPKDLRLIDWSTLLLIAGGITMGRMIETSGLVSSASERFALVILHPMFALFVLCLGSAVLSALMSNTATAVLLIPLANAVMPEPSTAILIAVSSSFGMPFVISTPPNAMAYGEGGVRTSDLLYPGLVIMLIGCAVVALTGRPALNFAGIP